MNERAQRSQIGRPRSTVDGDVAAPATAPAPAPIAAPASGLPTIAPITAPLAAPIPAPDRPRSPTVSPQPERAMAATKRTGMPKRVLIVIILPCLPHMGD